MMNRQEMLRRERLVLSVLTALIFCAGYLFIRTAWEAAASVPFAQEMVLNALSVIATVLITALLLNRQTAGELQKEQDLRLFEARERLYERVFGTLQQILQQGRIEARQAPLLQLFTNHLAMLGSAEVLHAWNDVLEELLASWIDREITLEEGRRLSALLAHLAIAMRGDLIGDSIQMRQLIDSVLDSAADAQALRAESEVRNG